MASVALQAAGNAILPGAGGVIGAMIGGYIDQNFLLPALFPEDDIQGPRVDDLQLSAATEGAPVNFCIGPENKVAGTVIWMSPIREVAETEEVGGKGGGQEVTSFSYFVDIAVSYGDGTHLTNGINSVPKIWTQGNLLYDDDPDINISDDSMELSVTRIEFFENFNDPLQVTRVEMEIESPNGGPDLSEFRTGKNVVVAGWADGDNNGTFKCLFAEIDATSGVTKVTLKNPDAADESSGTSTPTLDQTNPKFEPGAFDSITFYPGTHAQTADPTIVSIDGATNTPAYKGDSYFVIANLALENYGQQPPQTWAVLVEAELSTTLPEAFRQILGKARRDDGQFFTEGEDYDISGISTSTLVRGYTIRGPRSVAKMLQPLMIAYDVLVQDTGTMLKFFDRANAETVVVENDDKAAHPIGSDAPRTVRFFPRPKLELPKEITVSYIDPRSDYQKGSQRFKRLQSPSDGTVSIRLDLVLTGEEAQCIGRRIFWTRWANRERVAVQLPPSYIRYVENDILQVEGDDGETYPMLVDNRDRGSENELLLYEGVVERATTLSFDVSECQAEEPEIPNQKLYVPPELELFIMDIAPLQDMQANTMGVYFAIAARDSTALFASASLYDSVDDGTTFLFLDSTDSETAMGITTEELGSATPGLWDRTNTLNVQLYHGSLESRTEDAVLAGANTMLVGNEVIRFATATLESDGTYTLSDLLRGQRDTDDEIDQHAPNDRVVLLNSTGMRFLEMNLSTIGSTRDYRAVPNGGAVADFDTQEDDVVIAGNVLRPFAPANVQGSRDGSDNLTITWDFRTRATFNILTGPVPQLEPNRVYEIDILDAPGGSVLRTITVTDTETATYTAAEQTTDGLTPGDDVDLEIFQVSTKVGRSKPEAATI